MMENVEISWSAARPRLMAASMPSGTPTSVANRMATTVCWSVGTICVLMISSIVPSMNSDVPRSPRKMSLTQ